MRKFCILLLIILVAFFSTVSIFAQYWDEIRYAHSIINIRADRSTKSRVVDQLKAGNKVRVDFLKDNWFAIFRIEETVRDENKALGYVYAPLLKPIPPESKKPLKKAPSIMKYKIVERQVDSPLGRPRMVYRVVVEVDQKPSGDQLKKIATELWKNANKKWEEFVVFMYLPRMDTDGFAYGVAEFRPHGLKGFRIQNVDYR